MASNSNQVLGMQHDGTTVTCTYGDLIDLYESVMISVEDKHSVQDVFLKKFRESFPNYHLSSRPGRFIDTVQRIVAPTRPSLRGPPKLKGSPLATYRKKSWKPRVSNPKGSNSDVQFPVTSEYERISSLQADEICELKEKLSLSQKELHVANNALRDITNKMRKTEKERESALNKASKLYQSNVAAKDDIAQLIEELDNNETPRQELSDDECNDPTFSPANSDHSEMPVSQRPVEFTVTKSGKTYSNSVRKLYYTLLSTGVSVSRIDGLVKDVVKWSNPSVDASKLKLPKRSCSSYMRKEELKVVSNAHKAMSLCDEVALGKGLRINTDGTTKNQKKLGGVAINGMTISVNELADGSSLTAISDVARELEKLRNTVHALGIPNADAINWSVIESSTSDSAATQKHFNCLLQQRKEAEMEVSNTDSQGAHLNFIESFCAMHLGVNLRKAFLSGVKVSADNSAQAFQPVNTFVHQFCKVFGKYGTPEYACGVQGFLDDNV